jgi:hypothetical protein
MVQFPTPLYFSRNDYFVGFYRLFRLYNPVVHAWIFFAKVMHIAGDGHCGFRALADLHSMFDDGYQNIHLELLKDMTNDLECYL